MTPSRRYFLAGTDTEVGKTFVSCALLHRARGDGLVAVGMKPVAAGAIETEAGWVNQDALDLARASSIVPPYAELNPVLLREPIAPHLAARHEGRSIELAPILAAADSLARRCDCLLIEGVGGFRVPLGQDVDTADLARALRAPVILVVGMRLGCINHALLSAEAIRARGLELAGWVANGIDPDMLSFEENVFALQERLGCPLLGTVPFDPQCDPVQAATHLALPPDAAKAPGVIAIIDSAAELGPQHAGRVVITGSHGGASAARYALAARPKLCFFNDAGEGKEAAGIQALAMLEGAGLAAACYSHQSARIGDGRDAFGNGRVSRLNALAARLGVRAGQPVVEGASLATTPP